LRSAQDLADKLARDCRSIMMSPWYRQIFRTRLAAHRNAVQDAAPASFAALTPRFLVDSALEKVGFELCPLRWVARTHRRGLSAKDGEVTFHRLVAVDRAPTISRSLYQ
jgi:hypothetical protein